jgi:hypothetical protein
MVTFYNAKDRAIYDAGDKFVPQTKYLQSDYIPTEGISYAGDGSPVSYANSGIMSGYMTPPPIIYPPINQGGDGGDGPVDTGPPGSYDSAFDPVTEKEDFSYDIEEGTIAEEDDEEEGKIGKMGLAKIAGATLFGGPFSGAYTAYNEREKAKQDKIDKINADINAQYGYGTGAASQGDMDSYGVDKDTGNPGNYDQDYDMKDGGRAGYFFGGRVNYKAGGRIGFKGGGGQIGGTADMSGGNIPGPGDTGGEGGDNPSDDSDTQFGGGNDNKQTSNPKTSIMDKIRYNPIINNPFTKLAGRIGLYTVNPTLLGLDYRTASQLKGVYDKATDDLDDEDVTMNKFANGGLASIL